MSIVRDGKGNPHTCVTHGHRLFRLAKDMKHSSNDDDSPRRGAKRKRAHSPAESDDYHDRGSKVSVIFNLHPPGPRLIRMNGILCALQPSEEPKGTVDTDKKIAGKLARPYPTLGGPIVDLLLPIAS
jgi:hypothetical protein